MDELVAWLKALADGDEWASETARTIALILDGPFAGGGLDHYDEWSECVRLLAVQFEDRPGYRTDWWPLTDARRKESAAAAPQVRQWSDPRERCERPGGVADLRSRHGRW
jgi:hypothetical protein